MYKIETQMEIEFKYAKQFINNGNPAKNESIALGSHLIKQVLNCSDRETVEQVKENPYLQYFLGLKEYEKDAPFGASTMTARRKSFSVEFLSEINEIIIHSEKTDKNYNDDNNNPPN